MADKTLVNIHPINPAKSLANKSRHCNQKSHFISVDTGPWIPHFMVLAWIHPHTGVLSMKLPRSTVWTKSFSPSCPLLGFLSLVLLGRNNISSEANYGRKLAWPGLMRSNQSVLKEISPEYSLEGLMLKLKLQHSDHLMRRTDSLEKTLILGKDEGRRRRGWQRIKWFDGIVDSTDMILSKLWETVKAGEAWRAEVHGVKKSQTRLSDWTASGRRQCPG